MPKIGFCGTVSCGKTSLVKALHALPEFKDYTLATERSKYLRDLGIPLNTDSTIKGQIIFLAERSSELLQSDIITDRTVIDVMAFTNLAKSIPFIQADVYEQLASQLISEYDYIFYVSPKGVELEDNGVRTIDPEYRASIDKEIKGILDKYKGRIRNYGFLEGSIEERIEEIKRVVFF